MIRKLNANDKSDFLSLAYDFYHSEAVLSPIPQRNHAIAFDELMRSDEYMECYIIEHIGNVAGYALLSKTFSHEAGGLVLWLEELYISKEYRGNGLSREFLAYMNKNLPASRYRLEVEPDNDSVMSLYAKFGYKPLPYVQMVKDFR